MNLSAYIDEIIEANCIDSLKIEGRTKSVYYAGITARAYKMAINDYYNKTFDKDKYVTELNTTKHRGFTDAYLLSKPFDKRNTQKHDSAISQGTHEVSGLVTDSKYFMCKYKIYPNTPIELVIPEYSIDNIKVYEMQNDIGKIYKKEDKYFIEFFKIITMDGKELTSVHSGNINPILLPIPLPESTFLRQKII
jgi:putative protease